MLEGKSGLGLLTDFYQLTMGEAYWSAGMSDHEACFHLSFRANPFDGGYAISCGLEHAIAYLRGFGFAEDDLDYLRQQTGNDGAPLFSEAYLARLADTTLELDVHAVPEGTVVFAGEPLMRVMGPIWQCQLVETALLNVVNFQTLVATKASRVCLAAGGDPVVEFGLRRAQGPDGGLSASRAAYVGGCVGTSNAYAGKLSGVPVAGTHAHSWIMAFDTEIEAFESYARALPNNCTFLVDTYNTLDGVRRAVEVGRRLRDGGHEMIGIRLDSGDLAWLSIKAREILDEAGFPDAVVLASNELDEHLIASLKDQGAAIDAWGVGTKLATSFDQPALGGVYKLSAVREPGGRWEPRIKLSEQFVKVTMPGILGVRRYYDDDGMDGDMVYDVTAPPAKGATMVDPADPTRRKSFSARTRYEELLVPVMESGACVYECPPLAEVRSRAAAQLERLDPSITRFLNPHTYPVGLERAVHDRRIKMIADARGVPVDDLVPSDMDDCSVGGQLGPDPSSEGE
jgi:nicotinate phosphoribosyltransferase